MIFVLTMKQEYRQHLGAITYVDGTARVQTVSRETNPRYWELIEAFRQRTGVAMLLNTSFNNHVEPIVDSMHDAIACFLTTGLHYLVVGDYLASKKNLSPTAYLGLAPELPIYTEVRHTRTHVSTSDLRDSFTLGHSLFSHTNVPISEAAFRLLMSAGGNVTVGEMIERSGAVRQSDQLIEELIELWSARAIGLRPRPRPPTGPPRTHRQGHWRCRPRIRPPYRGRPYASAYGMRSAASHNGAGSSRRT